MQLSYLVLQGAMSISMYQCERCSPHPTSRIANTGSAEPLRRPSRRITPLHRAMLALARNLTKASHDALISIEVFCCLRCSFVARIVHFVTHLVARIVRRPTRLLSPLDIHFVFPAYSSWTVESHAPQNAARAELMDATLGGRV